MTDSMWQIPIYEHLPYLFLFLWRTALLFRRRRLCDHLQMTLFLFPISLHYEKSPARHLGFNNTHQRSGARHNRREKNCFSDSSHTRGNGDIIVKCNKDACKTHRLGQKFWSPLQVSSSPLCTLNRPTLKQFKSCRMLCGCQTLLKPSNADTPGIVI